MQKVYRYVQALSLDVAVGALGAGTMAAKVAQIEMPLIWYFLLPISVWLMYTADHLQDAWRLKADAHTFRHYFHYKYFKTLLGASVFLSLTILALLPWAIPLALVYFGLGMGLLALLHFLLVSWVGNRISWWFQKELGVAIVYSVGVWGSPWMLLKTWPGAMEWLLFMQFFCLALINLLIFALFDQQTDELDGHSSFVRAIGQKRAKEIVWGLCLLVIISGVYIWLQGGTLAIQLCYAGMMGILGMIVGGEKYFAQQERYRVWGDGAFLLPGIWGLWP